MGFLFDRLRPQIDETSLYDDEAREADPVRPSRPPAVRWKVVLTCWVIVLVGVALVLGAGYIGARVEWVVTDTISGRRGGQIWAWVPMALLSALGLATVWYGFFVMVTSRKNRR